MVHLVIVVAAILAHSAHVLALYQEELPFQPNPDDESMYLFMDTRAVKDSPEKPREYDIEARRRSILEKNFVRLGRRDPLSQVEPEYDDYGDEFARPTRSGSEKTDHFVRFGRGRSDFVRFGRDSGKDKGSREKDINFIRFGRSPRSKREVYNARKGNGFLRFGKNDNFMRFGRKQDEPTSASVMKNEEPQRQSDLLEQLNRYPESPIVRLLTALAYKLRDNSKCSRLLE